MMHFSSKSFIFVNIFSKDFFLFNRFIKEQKRRDIDFLTFKLLARRVFVRAPNLCNKFVCNKFYILESQYDFPNIK